jgi:protein-S-isoprenylcysteine O-methyltransferase Ste14
VPPYVRHPRVPPSGMPATGGAGALKLAMCGSSRAPKARPVRPAALVRKERRVASESHRSGEASLDQTGETAALPAIRPRRLQDGEGAAKCATRHGDPPLNAWIRGVLATALVGVAGRWNGPTVLVLATTAGIAFFDLGRRDRVERDDGADGDGIAAGFAPEPYGMGMQLAFLAILTVGAWDNRSLADTWRHPGLLGVAGFAVIMLGVALRQSAANALGRQFTVGLSVLADHVLIVSGPYRWVRHPNYAGLLLVAIGTAMMVWSPSAAGVSLVVWLPLALLRIDREERALHARLGAAWGRYSRDRWCIVPGVY